MTDEYIWVIFVAEQTNRFPDFYPIGVFTVRDRAVEEIDKLPRDKNYQILRLPVNRMFPYYHKKSGGVVGMDAIRHEHFHFKELDE